ncbi:MAG: hypothetical protein H0X62_01920 [Bacteroidetes bacterium]|nr:hypothetical protein [Bacteroidota bacterium]
MDTVEKELTSKIFEITNMIQEDYPELYIHLEEFRDTLTMKEHPKVDIETLADYYETLKTVAQKYIEEKDKNDLYKLNHL